MSDNDTKPSTKARSASTSATSTTSNDDLQKQADEAAERGFFGSTPDTAPNSAYTVAGVVKVAKERKR